MRALDDLVKQFFAGKFTSLLNFRGETSVQSSSRVDANINIQAPRGVVKSVQASGTGPADFAIGTNMVPGAA